MKLAKEFVIDTAATIWRQVKAAASADVIGSWGISELYAQEISIRTIGDRTSRAALVMRVQGFNYKGYVIVALNEGNDLYDIYRAKTEDAELQPYRSKVYCDMLGDCLDKCIERGNMTEKQYKKRIQETYSIIL